MTSCSASQKCRQLLVAAAVGVGVDLMVFAVAAVELELAGWVGPLRLELVEQVMLVQIHPNLPSHHYWNLLRLAEK